MKYPVFKFISVFAFLFISSSSFAQDASVAKDRDLSIEIEPVSFAYRGISGGINYNVTSDNKLSLGLFFASLEVPDQLATRIFDNVGSSDTSTARLGFELALNARYSIPVFKQFKSNPYVGMIIGWEYFDIQQPAYTDKVRLSTGVLTPYLGYKFFFFKEMVYLNPQLRAVTYFGKKTSDVTRPEVLRQFFVLPQVSLGIEL